MNLPAYLFAAALALSPAVGAQDVPPAPPEGDPPARPGLGGDDDLAKQLVERIRKSLGEVNDALLDAADADAVSDEIDRALVNHRKAIRDIEELIEQVKYQQSGGGGGGGGQQQQQQQTSSSSQARESDGRNAPDPKQGGGSPEQQSGEQSGQGEEDQASQQPRGGETPADGTSEADGRQVGADAPPPEDPTAPYSRTDTDGRWGLLPPKLQERLMNLHVDDVPSRYRQHLDAYIRALNAQDDG